MASYNNILLFFFILVSFLSTFSSTEAQDSPVYLYKNCSTNITTPNSAFQINLRTLFSSLSSNATGDTQFYNTAVTSRPDPSESVYGLFMCRGDVSPQLCHDCVSNATVRLSSECSLSRQAVIWYDECMVRFSNRSFFSTVDTRPRLGLLNTANITNQESFMRLLFLTMNETANEAARPPIGVKKFATREGILSGFQSLYCLAQCTPDLSPSDCIRCLGGVIGDLPWCCEGKRGGRVLYPSCNVRYELYPFYRSNAAASPPTLAPALIPTTNTTSDSKFSQDPVYLHHNCTSNKTITANSTFQKNLKVLLSNLSSKATSGNKIFSYKDKVDDTVFGLFLCRGDLLNAPLCGQCVQNATHRISSKCGSFQEAIIWYSHCMLRYSYRKFSTVDKSPVYYNLNVTSSPIPEENFFTVTLANKLAEFAVTIGNSVERYSTESLKLNDLQTMYTLGQCMQDLSSDDCTMCLQDVINTTIPWSRLGSVGGRVMYPSCNVRFELFQFYMDGEKLASPNDQGSTSPSKPIAGYSRLHLIKMFQWRVLVCGLEILGHDSGLGEENCLFGRMIY